jgi:hypothetical protein
VTGFREHEIVDEKTGRAAIKMQFFPGRENCTFYWWITIPVESGSGKMKAAERESIPWDTFSFCLVGHVLSSTVLSAAGNSRPAFWHGTGQKTD